MSSKTTGIKLQRKITDEIDKLMEKNPDLFYRTRTDFIVDAIRRHVKHLKEA